MQDLLDKNDHPYTKHTAYLEFILNEETEPIPLQVKLDVGIHAQNQI